MVDSGAEQDDTQILQAALPTAFSSGHVRKESVSGPKTLTGESSGKEPISESKHESAGSTSQTHDDSWRAEYEVNLQSWRTQSAEARDKAENERARWESIRAAEREASTRPKPDERQGRTDQDAGWETIGKRTTPGSSGQISLTASRGPVDASKNQTFVTGSFASPRLSRETTGDEGKLSLSQKWVTVPTSPTSSYPSLSFPDNSNTSSRDMRHEARRPINQAPPQSATLTIFNSSLPTRVRVSALFSSLAINLLLPFVNGVMLGFGEIFAKTVVIGWFGWKLPGSMMTSVGIRSSKTRSG